MKRLIAFVLVTFCITGLIGCTQTSNNVTTKNNMANNETKQQNLRDTCNEFTIYLDEINLVPGLSQSDFLTLLKKYKYDDNVVTDIVEGMHYDGPSGGGWMATSDLFGFYNDYMVEEDNNSANYLNRLYTTVQLEGLDMPFNINFDDTLSTVLQKLEIDVDWQDRLTSDKDNAGILTLYNDDRSSLQIIDCEWLPDSSMQALYNFELKYTENYQTTRIDGRTVSVTRCISLFFFGDNDKLGGYEVSVNENFQIN